MNTNTGLFAPLKSVSSLKGLLPDLSKIPAVLKKARCRASFTIEAAVVVPVSMLIVAAVLGFSLKLHDQVSSGASLAAEEIESLDGSENRDTLLKYLLVKDFTGLMTGETNESQLQKND